MRTCYRNTLDVKTCCCRGNNEKSLHIWKVYHVQKLSNLLIKLIIQVICSLSKQMIMWCESRNLFLQMKMWHLSPPSVICIIGQEYHWCYGIEFDTIWAGTAFVQNLCFICWLTSKGRILSLFFQTFRKLFASLAVPLGGHHKWWNMGLCVWPWNRGACRLYAWRASGKFILVWRHTDLFLNIYMELCISIHPSGTNCEPAFRLRYSVLCTGRCVAGKSWEVVCWWLVSPVQQCCCSPSLPVCDFFTKNIINFMSHSSYATVIVLCHWNSSWHGIGGNLMTSHLQNNHRLHLPSTKHVRLPVVQSLNMLIQFTVVLLQREECRGKNTTWMFISYFDEICLYQSICWTL